MKCVHDHLFKTLDLVVGQRTDRLISEIYRLHVNTHAKLQEMWCANDDDGCEQYPEMPSLWEIYSQISD